MSNNFRFFFSFHQLNIYRDYLNTAVVHAFVYYNFYKLTNTCYMTVDKTMSSSDCKYYFFSFYIIFFIGYNMN